MTSFCRFFLASIALSFFVIELALALSGGKDYDFKVIVKPRSKLPESNAGAQKSNCGQSLFASSSPCDEYSFNLP